MKDERIGNDINVIWSILQAEEQPLNLERYNCTLYLKNSFGKTKVNDFKIEGNVILWTFKGKDQKSLGKHSLTLILNEGMDDMHTTDACNLVNLVPCSCQVGGSDDDGIKTETIELTSTLEYVAGTYDDTALWKELENKVDKVEGLGLSEENYTTEEKEKLAGLQNYDDSGIKEELGKKAEKSEIPTKISELENDSKYVTETQAMRDYQPKGDYATSQQLTELSAEVGKKQDTITDLETIRSGAAKGATALQSVPDTYATKQYVDNAIKDIPQGGGEPSDILAALYRRGVVSQDLDREGNANIGYKNVVSNPVYGVIPKQFIDQVCDEYAVKFNEQTGYFEYADITNLAYDEVMHSVSLCKALLTTTSAYSLSQPITHFLHATGTKGSTYDKKFRTMLIPKAYTQGDWVSPANLPSRWCVYLGNYSLYLEIGFNSALYPESQSYVNFYMCQALRKAGNFHFGEISSYNNFFSYCYSLEEIGIKRLSKNTDFSWSPLLKNTSIYNMISNSAATSAITIKLHADAYARAMADAEILAALEAHPNISLASA